VEESVDCRARKAKLAGRLPTSLVGEILVKVRSLLWVASGSIDGAPRLRKDRPLKKANRTMRSARSPRRFNRTDAAVLVLATAVGLSAIRSQLGSMLKAPMVEENGRLVASWWAPVVILGRGVILEVVLMAWSVSWLVLQVRPPRQRMRRLVRQPGFAACFSSALVLLVSGPITAATLTSISRSGTISGDYWILFELWSAVVSCQIGAAVAAGWALLALGRQCHAKSGWLDRVGQVFGLAWVLMIPANLSLPFWLLLLV
jgi:hypothetical protein